ncbi:MAG: four helix bundle protein [Actinomycetota bacterium]
MQDFRRLHVWHEAVDTAVSIYRATENLPAAEEYGLRAQMRAAAVSVSSNIAEGCGRPGRGDMARFLGIAIGSVCELQSQLLIAQHLGILADAEMEDPLRRVDDLRRGLIALHGRVKTRRTAFADDSGAS